MKLRWVILLVLLFPVVAHVFYAATHSTFADYYVTVDELLADDSTPSGQMVRVGGGVVPGSIRYDTNSGTLRFLLRGEQGEEIAVVYSGRVPNIFRDNAHAILEGNLDTQGTFRARTFRARTLMVRCPHTYTAAV